MAHKTATLVLEILSWDETLSVEFHSDGTVAFGNLDTLFPRELKLIHDLCCTLEEFNKPARKGNRNANQKLGTAKVSRASRNQQVNDR